MFRKAIALFIALNISSSMLAQNWTALSEQLEILSDGWSVINTIYNDGDSALYVGGKFTQSESGEILSKIAKWDGVQFHPVGCGFDFDCSNVDDLTTITGNVSSIIRFQDTLYAAGSFSFSGSESLQNVAKFDGIDWKSVGQGFDMSVNKLVVLNDTLFACGGFTFSGNNSVHGLAKWNGVSWTEVNDFPQFFPTEPNSISDIEYFQESYYVSGNFSNTDATILDLVMWNQTSWIEVGGGFYGGLMGIGDIALYLDQIVFSGSMSIDEASNNPGTGIVAWNGNEWFDFQGGIDDPESTNNGGVFDLKISGNRIYITGTFNHTGDIPANQLAFWEDDHWCSFVDVFEIGGTQTSLKEIAFFQDTLYVIGGFNGISGNSSIKGIAKYLGGDICEVSPVVEKEDNATLEVYPNPVDDILNVSGILPNDKTTLKILDTTGRILSTHINHQQLDVSHLSSGIYFMQVSTDESRAVLRFVKE